MTDRLSEEGRLSHDGAMREYVTKDDAHLSSANEGKQTGVVEGAARGREVAQMRDVEGQRRAAGQGLLNLPQEGSVTDAVDQLGLGVQVSCVLERRQKGCLVVGQETLGGVLLAQCQFPVIAQQRRRRHESSAEIVQHIAILADRACAEMCGAASVLLTEQAQAVAVVGMPTLHHQLAVVSINETRLFAQRTLKHRRTFDLARVHGE